KRRYLLTSEASKWFSIFYFLLFVQSIRHSLLHRIRRNKSDMTFYLEGELARMSWPLARGRGPKSWQGGGRDRRGLSLDVTPFEPDGFFVGGRPVLRPRRGGLACGPRSTLPLRLGPIPRSAASD